MIGVLGGQSVVHCDAFATIFEDQSVAKATQHRAIAALSAHLRETGVMKGDRVAIAARNLPEWIVAFFAVTVIGAIAVPLNAWWTGDELAIGLSDSGGRMRNAHDDGRHRHAPHPAELDGLGRLWGAPRRGGEPGSGRPRARGCGRGRGPGPGRGAGGGGQGRGRRRGWPRGPWR